MYRHVRLPCRSLQLLKLMKELGLFWCFAQSHKPLATYLGSWCMTLSSLIVDISTAVCICCFSSCMLEYIFQFKNWVAWEIFSSDDMACSPCLAVVDFNSIQFKIKVKIESSSNRRMAELQHQPPSCNVLVIWARSFQTWSICHDQCSARANHVLKMRSGVSTPPNLHPCLWPSTNNHCSAMTKKA